MNRRMRSWPLALLGFSSVTSASAQSLTGTTGLVSIPTAAVPRDGALAVGMNLLGAPYPEQGPAAAADQATLVQFASLGFPPFLEVGLRLSRKVDAPRQALGDRMVSVRLRVLEERARRPALVVGAHDLVGTRIYHAEYAAASKRIERVPLAGTVGVHLGYGGDLLRLRARGRQFTGWFGGVSASPRPWLELLGEHDAEHVNAGVRLRVWRIAVLGAAQEMQHLSGGISYTHPLN